MREVFKKDHQGKEIKSNFEFGEGEIELVPDLGTLRESSWNHKTAFVYVGLKDFELDQRQFKFPNEG